MGYTSKLVNGSKIGEFWLYKYAGLDADGKWLIYDKDNNVVPATDANKTDANKHYVGNGVPQLIISWDNNFHYRDFDSASHSALGSTSTCTTKSTCTKA